MGISKTECIAEPPDFTHDGTLLIQTGAGLKIVVAMNGMHGTG